MGTYNIKPKLPLVYLVTNKINGHRYIGTTKRLLCQRKGDHFCGARKGRKDMVIFDAIRKYGEENFKFTVLQYYPTVAEAYKGEEEYIAKLKPEYNRCQGGAGVKGVTFTPERLKRLKELGKANNAEWQKKYAHLGPTALSRRVICLDDGLIYESASTASRYYKVAKSALIEMCIGKKTSSGAIRRSVGGLKFKYSED